MWVRQIVLSDGSKKYIWTTDVNAQINAGDIGIAEVRAYIAELEQANLLLNRELNKYKRLARAACRCSHSSSNLQPQPQPTSSPAPVFVSKPTPAKEVTAE